MSERKSIEDCLHDDISTRAVVTCEKEAIMSSNDVQMDRNKGETIYLTEEDIPGAKLSTPMDAHTMAQLKWWLLCRGIKVPNSWNKKKLMSRYST